MNRANVLTKDEWPEWNINHASPPVITIEGHHIQHVFSMIHTQLETLKKILSEQNRSMIELSKKDDKSAEKYNKVIEKLSNKIEKLEKELKDGDTAQLLIKLNKAEERIKLLEEQLNRQESSKLNDQVHQNTQQIHENEKHIQELMSLVESVDLHELTDKLKKYEQQIKILEIEKYDTHSRLIKLEDQACWYRNQAEKMNEEYAKLYENNEITAREIREFRDLLLNYEKNREKGTDTTSSAQATNNNPPGSSSGGSNGIGHDLTPFQENIIQSELNKLTNLISNLDHKHRTLSSQLHDLEENYQSKLDKKMDWMKQWIMKSLREFLNNQNANETEDQTDIGKVRCLVCNHVTKKIDPDTPYNKPDFKNTLGYLHDQHQHINTNTDDGVVYRSGFKIPLKEYQESHKLKSMLSPQIQSSGTSPQPPQANRLIGSKFARIRAVPSSQGQPSSGEYLIIDDDVRLDLTHDRYLPHTQEKTASSRPKTSSNDNEKGVNSNFYKEMER